MEIGPHPHIGLQTVTWLIDGDVVHHDSLGSEQRIRPGQLNLMTAGRGVAHAEETPATYAGRNHGVQLWVALPEGTRHGPAAFEHHPELPRIPLGDAVATVILGGFAGERSPARADTPLVGVELAVAAGDVTLELDPSFEHGLVVLYGALAVDGVPLVPGRLAFLGEGRDHLRLATADRALALLVGGAPFEARPLMWWNFVARTREEVDAATRDWNEGSPRFGDAVASQLPRIPAPPTPW
jgi:redox-sensitive bicupin YhaK (pirin superfamily)